MKRSMFPFFACSFTDWTGLSVGLVKVNAVVLFRRYKLYGKYSPEIFGYTFSSECISAHGFL